MTATLSSTLDPQTFIINFSDVWLYLFDQIESLFSLTVSDLDNSLYKYNISFDSDIKSQLNIFINFYKYVNSDNLLNINLNFQSSDNDEFNLLNTNFEKLISDYCPLPTTYLSSINIFILISEFKLLSF